MVSDLPDRLWCVQSLGKSIERKASCQLLERFPHGGKQTPIFSTVRPRLNAVPGLETVALSPSKPLITIPEMVHAPSASAEPHRVVLFGGQGSQSLFSPLSAKLTEQVTNSSAAAAILLSRCHAAFLEDISSLYTTVRKTSGIDPIHFHNSKDIITPREQYHTHGVIQATTICLYQLLHYLAEAERLNASFSSTFCRLLETTGFCSGMIPAIVVASSKTEEEFQRFGVEAFRLAFWIG